MIFLNMIHQINGYISTDHFRCRKGKKKPDKIILSGLINDNKSECSVKTTKGRPIFT